MSDLQVNLSRSSEVSHSPEKAGERSSVRPVHSLQKQTTDLSGERRKARQTLSPASRGESEAREQPEDVSQEDPSEQLGADQPGGTSGGQR